MNASTSYCLVFLLFFIEIQRSQTIDENGRALEVLQVTVKQGDMQRYVELDRQIWTSFLRQQTGFMRKTNLFPSSQLIVNQTEIYHIILWRTYRDWKSIAVDKLIDVNQRFQRALGYQPVIVALPDDNGFQESSF